MEEVPKIGSACAKGKGLSVKESMTCVAGAKTSDAVHPSGKVQGAFSKLVRRNETISGASPRRKTKIKEILVIASKAKDLPASGSDDKMNQTENEQFAELLSTNLSRMPLNVHPSQGLVVKEFARTLENEESIAELVSKFIDKEKGKLKAPKCSCSAKAVDEALASLRSGIAALKFDLNAHCLSSSQEIDAKANAADVFGVRDHLEDRVTRLEKQLSEENRELRNEIILCQNKLHDYSRSNYKHYPVWTFAAFLAVYSIIYYTRRS